MLALRIPWRRHWTYILTRSFQWNPICWDWRQERTLCRRKLAHSLSARSHTPAPNSHLQHTHSVGGWDSRIHISEGKLAVVSLEVRIKSIMNAAGWGRRMERFENSDTVWQRKAFRKPVDAHYISWHEAFKTRHCLSSNYLSLWHLIHTEKCLLTKCHRTPL